MQHPLLLSYAAGETEGRGQDTVGVVQERSQSYHNYMVEAIKLVEHMLGMSIAHRHCTGKHKGLTTMGHTSTFFAHS